MPCNLLGCSVGIQAKEFGLYSPADNLPSQPVPGVLADCIKACKDNEECVGFSHQSLTGANVVQQCYLKKTGATRITAYGGFRTYIQRCPSTRKESNIIRISVLLNCLSVSASMHEVWFRLLLAAEANIAWQYTLMRTCTSAFLRPRALPVRVCAPGDRYFLADAGAKMCPSGSTPVAKEGCFHAAQQAGAAVGRELRKPEMGGAAVSVLDESNWTHTPRGCFVHEYSIVPNWKDQTMEAIAPHWGTGGENDDGKWQLVCEGKNSSPHPDSPWVCSHACTVSFWFLVCCQTCSPHPHCSPYPHLCGFTPVSTYSATRYLQSTANPVSA